MAALTAVAKRDSPPMALSSNATGTPGIPPPFKTSARDRHLPHKPTVKCQHNKSTAWRMCATHERRTSAEKESWDEQQQTDREQGKPTSWKPKKPTEFIYQKPVRKGGIPEASAGGVCIVTEARVVIAPETTQVKYYFQLQPSSVRRQVNFDLRCHTLCCSKMLGNIKLRPNIDDQALGSRLYFSAVLGNISCCCCQCCLYGHICKRIYVYVWAIPHKLLHP